MRRIYLAGIENSGSEHWQAIWHGQSPGGLWIEHSDWNVAPAEVWLVEMRRQLAELEEPSLFVAHSLGCLLLAEYLARHGPAGVLGAFLVAVPDVRAPSFPTVATGFRLGAECAMPVPSMVVASDNDPYGSLEHARRVATHWGSRLEEIGQAGHINADSGLGAWPDGAALLEKFLVSLRR